MKEMLRLVIAIFGIPLLLIGMMIILTTSYPPPKDDPLWRTTTYSGTIANITYDSTTKTTGAFLTGTSTTTTTYTNIELTDGTVFRVDDSINGLHKGQCYTFWLRYDYLVQYKECL